jgi:hypothetical protein
VYLVIRGDRLYEGYSVTYTKPDGTKTQKGMIGKSLGSKSELLAKDPHALEKLRAILHSKSAPNQATQETQKKLEKIEVPNPTAAYAGDPELRYANYVLRPIWEDVLKMKSVLDYQKSKTDIRFDVVEMIWQTIANRFVSPGSHRRHFLEQNQWLGNSLARCEVHQLYRMLTFMADRKKDIFRAINRSLKSEMPRDLSVVFYDVTNTWFETAWDDEEKLTMKIASGISSLESPTEEEKLQVTKSMTDGCHSTLRMRGPSKEHRKDPIVSIAMVVDRDGIPIDYRIYKGNASEKVTMEASIEALERDYSISNTIVVADNGLNTRSNMFRLAHNEHGFLIAHSPQTMKQSLLDELLADDGWQVLDGGSRKLKEVQRNDVSEDGVVVTYRLILGWSQKRYDEDMYRIRANEEAARLAVSGQKDMSAVKYGWRHYVKATKSKAAAIDQKKLDKDKRLAGYFGYIFKDSREYDENWPKLSKEEKKELTAEEVVAQYHCQTKIEECFRIMKTNFNMRPLYVFTDEHIEAQVMICVIALIILRILAKKLALAGTPMTTDQILDALDSAKVTAQVGKEEVIFRPVRAVRLPDLDQNPHDPIYLHEKTDLVKIMECVGLTPLPQQSNRIELARHLRTRFASDEQALGAKYVK